MPLYEFYCEPCHTVFTFRSVSVDTSTLPGCPRCGARLRREVSLFAHHVRGGEGIGDEAGAPEGDAAGRMDRVMAEMGSRVEALDEEDGDPREAVRVMRELAESGGLAFNREVREALSRIEAGEDPEKIDEEFAEVFESDNPFDESQAAGARGRLPERARRLRAPQRDPRWYDLQAGGQPE